ncbi:phosphoesterase family-domain-containing protein [Halenospora varia]|nr:phosphoesterase family-domain-containing protein [Halenospora varia]
MRFSLLVAGASVATAAYVPGKVFDRFFTIWLENQDFTAVAKNSHMKALAKEGILLTNYYGLTHPSQPNYIASVGGDYFGLNHDEYINIPRNVSTVVELFDSQNIEWKGYFEGLPGPGFMGAGSTGTDGKGWDYVRKHNPFLPYDSISLNGTRLARIQSFDDFASDVKSNTLPQYAHMSPDMMNDGHNTTLDYAAKWSDDFLSPLLKNAQFMNNTLILLTYDESATYPIPNKIVSILLGGAIPANLKGTNDSTFYTHYSILSTLENNWGLPNLGRYDVGANVFDMVSKKTGYLNQPPSNELYVNNSLSYGGFLHSEPSKWKPIPPPNQQLIGAGGKGIDETVARPWLSTKNQPTPYDGSSVVYDGGNGISDLNSPVYMNQAPGPNVTATATPAPAATTKASDAGKTMMLGMGSVGFAIWAFAIAAVVS